LAVLRSSATLATSSRTIRSLDPIRLAAAQRFGRDLSVLVSYDDRMLAAAEELGIRVTSPR